MNQSLEFIGLTSEEVLQLKNKFGLNKIEEKKNTLLSRLMKAVYTPMSLMFIVAGSLSYFSNEIIDVGIILILFIINVVVSVWHEAKADKSLEKLQEKLNINVKTLRDGKWSDVSSVDLVPGDIIELSVGNIVPADVTFLTAKNLSVNESVITGESLPRDKTVKDKTFSGAFISTGLSVAKVIATGRHTYFGETVTLIDNTKRTSRLEKDILSISKFLSIIAIIVMIILTLVLLYVNEPFLKIATLDISLLIAGIPVALPTVMTLIISMGVVTLSAKSIIVRRLSSLEDLANVNILLSDKTGTLTQDKIKVEETHFLSNLMSEKDIWSLVLACSPTPELNPIEKAIDEKAKELNITAIETIDYIPADSDRKRATIIFEKDGNKIAVSFGAPETILELSEMDEKSKEKYKEAIQHAADEGFRALVIAISKNDKEKNMTPLAVLFIADAVRKDAKKTISEMHKYGVDVKMVTGDGRDVALHVAKQLGIKGNIIPREELISNLENVKNDFSKIAGFAEVMPKDKYNVVNMTRSLSKGYVVAVTGDGINDMPPIRDADVGFAVANAVDALKSSADIVLTTPGISVISDAIVEARKIFARMYNYSVYRISESFRLILTIAIIGVIFGTYPLTPVEIILIALLNDVPIISMAFDRVAVARAPATANPRRRLIRGTIFGMVGIVNSMFVLWVAYSLLHLPWEMIQMIFFLKLTVSGHMLLYVAHTEEVWYKFLPSKQVIWSTTITQIIATLIAYFGIISTALPISYIVFIWVWAFFWMQISELLKQLHRKFSQ